MPSKRRRIRVTEGSGNMFADVGIEQPEEYLAKAELARQIMGALDAQRLTQIQAARILSPELTEQHAGEEPRFGREVENADAVESRDSAGARAARCQLKT